MLFRILFITSLLCPLLLFGQTEDTLAYNLSIDEIEVSASRTGSTIEQLPLSVAFVTNQQINQVQALTPVEALNSVPGISLQSDGGLTSTPVIRGLSRERAPILIDGNSFVGGRIRSYALMDPFQIERIEVIKGPASAFWGSDAVGGLVNVITRKAESGYGKSFSAGASIYGGIQSVNDLTRGRVEVEGRGSGFDFLIGHGARSAGNTMTPEGEVTNSQFSSNYWDWNIGYSPAENHRLEFSGKYFKNDSVGFPGGLGAPGPPVRFRYFSPDEQTGYNFNYTGTDISDKIEAVGVSAYMKQQRLHIDMTTNVFFPGTMNANRIIHPNLDVDVDFGGIKAFMRMRQSETAKLTLGVDYLREHRIGTFRDLVVDIFNPMGVQVNQVTPPPGQIQPDSYSNSIGLFAVEEINVNEKLDVLLALRFDNVSTSIDSEPFFIPTIAGLYNDDNRDDSDNAITGNLGLKYHASPEFDLTANIANSFRGTDLFSKYHFADGLLPNPELDPERGFFYELGAEYDNNKFGASLNFYQNSLNNLFVPANVEFEGTPAIQNQNIGEAKITGFEYQLAYKLGLLSRIYLNGSVINGKNTVTDAYLPFMPANNNLLGIQYTESSNKFFGALEIDMNAKQDKLAPAERATDAYTLINVNAGVNLHQLISGFPHIRLIAGINNLTDKSYQSHIFRGVPANVTKFFAPGRSINITAIAKFGVADRN